MHLSPAGKLLLDYADRLLDLANEAREAVHDAKPRGLLRLGSMESTAAMRLPPAINRYLSRYPEVTLELRIGTPRELAAAVREGELDGALVAEPVADAPFEKIPLYQEELVIIAAANHPPIRSPRDVSGRPVLAFDAGCSYRQRMEDWFAGSGEMFDRVIETSSYHAILGCAVAGMGISMVPRIVLKTFPDLKQLSIHPIAPEFSSAPTVFIRRKGVLSPKVNALIEVLLAQPDATLARADAKTAKPAPRPKPSPRGARARSARRSAAKSGAIDRAGYAPNA